MAEKYSNTGTTTTSRNEVATLLRITKKAKENVNKTVSNRTSEKTGIFKTDVKDQRLQTTLEVEDKLNKNQQDLQSNQRLQTTLEVEDKLNKNQQDLQSNQRLQTTLEVEDKLNKIQQDLQSNQRLQTTPEVEDKSNKNQQDIQSNQRVQKKHVVEDKTNKNQQDVAQLLSNVHFYDVLTFLNGEIQDLEMKLQGIQDIEMKLQDQRVQKKHVVEDKTNKNQQDVAQLQSRIQYIEMKLQDKLEYIESKISFIYPRNLIVDVEFKKRLHIDMYLAEDSTKYIERVKALGKVYDELFDEMEKSILNVGNDKITKQRSGKKEKIEWWNKVITEKKRLISQCLKEVVQQENNFQKENQLTEQEKTELVDQLKEYMLKERESDLQKEDELKEKVKAELPADNILFHRTKVRNAKSKMNTSSLYRAFNLYRKNVLERELLSVEQLSEALYSIKSPHYIWPSGHPLILSKERQIEPDFSSNEHMERLHSFVNGTNRRHRTWNSDQIVRPEPMVLAGFSYDGEDDKVVCKSCGAISDVNDWSDDDEDYAFTMHRRTGSSHCEFLRIFDPRRSKM